MTLTEFFILTFFVIALGTRAWAHRNYAQWFDSLPKAEQQRIISRSMHSV